MDVQKKLSPLDFTFGKTVVVLAGALRDMMVMVIICKVPSVYMVLYSEQNIGEVLYTKECGLH